MKLQRIPNRLASVAYSATSPMRHAPQGEAPKPTPERKPWDKAPGSDKRRLTGRPWRRVVERIKYRDRYTCQLCKHITEQGEVDHRIPLSQGGTDEDDNLQWLCVPCHKTKTHTEQRRG